MDILTNSINRSSHVLKLDSYWLGLLSFLFLLDRIWHYVPNPININYSTLINKNDNINAEKVVLVHACALTCGTINFWVFPMVHVHKISPQLSSPIFFSYSQRSIRNDNVSIFIKYECVYFIQVCIYFIPLDLTYFTMNYFR